MSTPTTRPASAVDRRSAVTTVTVTSLAFVMLAGWLVPWDWVPGGTLVPASAGDVFSDGDLARIERFSTASRWLAWSSYAVSLLVALALGLTPRGARLVRRTAGPLPWWLVVPLGVLVVLLVGRLATLPFSVVLQARRRAFGLSEQAWPAWLGDVATSLTISVVLAGLLALTVVGLARRFPRRWFLPAGAASATAVVVASFLYPVLVEPLFNDFRSLPQGPLRTAVLELADEQGVVLDDVLVADASRRTASVNAYVSGFAGSRRVVLYDNLVDLVPPAEVRVVVAHELAHARYRDVLTGTLLGAMAAAGAPAGLALLLTSRRLRRRCDVSGPEDPAVVAFLLAAFAVVGFVSSPVESGISRAIEARADRASIIATGEPEVFVRMQRELVLRNLSDPSPPPWSQWWFGTHPTALQRIGLPAAMEEAP